LTITRFACSRRQTLRIGRGDILDHEAAQRTAIIVDLAELFKVAFADIVSFTDAPRALHMMSRGPWPSEFSDARGVGDFGYIVSFHPFRNSHQLTGKAVRNPQSIATCIISQKIGSVGGSSR